MRDCCCLLPVDERRLLHVTMAVSAIALDVTPLLPVEALIVLVLLCQILGVIFLLLSSHELACIFARGVLALLAWPFTEHICMSATPFAASLAMSSSFPDLGKRLQPAGVHDQVMLQHLVLHVQRYQAVLHLVLNFDACKLLVKQLENAVSLVNSNASSFCIRPALLDIARGLNFRTSRLQASKPSLFPALPTMSNAIPFGGHHEWKVESLTPGRRASPRS